jgi:hypothetical protein
LWSLVVEAVRVVFRRGERKAFRVAVAVRWVTVMERKVSINKARTVTLLAVAAGGLHQLVEQQGRTPIRTPIPDKAGVMPVRLVRAAAVVADHPAQVPVAAAETVGMAAAAVVVRGTAALAVAAGLVTSHLMLSQGRLLERPAAATAQ